MSVRVNNISKKYGEQFAVKKLSFEINKGEVVGFIGPNGAGKSTSMKIITGYLPPDTGEVWINEMNALENPMEVKRIIGYLPEHNPLYNDLYVKEYLGYVAGLYKIERKEIGDRIAEVIDLTGLEDEEHKKIGSLSKGYRQRVGLAQALIHDPEVLILDEPTSGLDPNQIIEIRNLISRTGKEKTILLSTHIMQEVDAICDRVIIINKGEIVADNPSERLNKSSKGKIKTILVETDKHIERALWKTISEITNIKDVKNQQYLLETGDEKDIRPLIFNLAVDQGFTILSMSIQEKSLEELFHELTKS